MFYHYLQMAFRRIWKKKGLSLLKILGLGMSVAASICLIQYVEYHWQYDHFQEKGDQIFRIQNDQYSEGILKQRSAMTYSAAPVALKEMSSEVLNYVRLGKWIANDVVFQYENKAIRDKNFYFADPSFFDIFSFFLLKGDPKTALETPNSLILSENNAKALFGEEDPIGKEVVFEGRKIFTVTGVSQSAPVQSHLHFGLLASYSTTQKMGFSIYANDHWDYFYTYAYVLLKKTADPRPLETQLTQWVNERKKENLIKDVFSLQPIKNIHLYSDLKFELGPTGNGPNLKILFGISLLTLLLAWINHFNIYTAGALDQLKALGIRKVVGASRAQIMAQLALESLLLSLLGIGVGVLLSKMLEPIIVSSFNIQLASLHWENIHWSGPFLILLQFLSGGTLLSILIPTYIISSFRPVHILNKTFKLPGHGIRIQKGLTVLQFTIIIALLVATMVIYQQTLFMQEKDPGIALQDKLILRGPLGTKHYEDLYPHYTQFKSTIEAYPEVHNMSLSREVPGNQLELVHDVRIDGRLSPLPFHILTVGPHFFETYKLPLVIGKIPGSILHSTKKVVINQAALELMGFENAQAALHKKLAFYDWDLDIVAVVKNHHHRSLHHPIVPIIYNLFDEATEDGYFSLAMNGPIKRKTVEKIKAAYLSAFPNTVFDHFELTDHYQAQYQPDIDFHRLNIWFTLLGVFIACLGLFGLSLIVFKQRIKEIGIRKVLGASISGIVSLLVGGLLRLVIIGFILATPLSWYLLKQWLTNFAFHIHLEWWVFAMAGLIALLVAFLTMSIQSVKAASTNPVTILKRE